MVLEVLVIHTLASAEPSWRQLEASGDVEQVPLEEERPERAVQLGRDMAAYNRQSLLSLMQDIKMFSHLDLRKCPESPRLLWNTG